MSPAHITEAAAHLRTALEHLNDFAQAAALDNPRATRAIQLMGVALVDIIRELNTLEDPSC
jgi:hypothetical protein